MGVLTPHGDFDTPPVAKQLDESHLVSDTSQKRLACLNRFACFVVTPSSGEQFSNAAKDDALMTTVPRVAMNCEGLLALRHGLVDSALVAQNFGKGTEDESFVKAVTNLAADR